MEPPPPFGDQGNKATE